MSSSSGGPSYNDLKSCENYEYTEIICTVVDLNTNQELGMFPARFSTYITKS